MEESSSSSPLLLHPSPSSSDNTTPITYTPSPRPHRDLPFLLLFSFLSLSLLSLGIFSIIRHNPNPNTCPTPNNLFLSSNLHQNILIWTLLITLLLSFPLLLLLLFLLRRFSAHLVYSLLPFLILVPLSLTIYSFAACTLSPSCSQSIPLAYRILLLVFLLLLLSLLLFLVISSWQRIRLSIHILRVSAAALSENVLLLAFLPALDVGLVAYVAPVVVFWVYASMNGEEVVGVRDDGMRYCEWKEERWVPAYYALAVVTVIWAAAIVLEAQVYVISGTVAQWYFSKEEGIKPHKSIRTSLRHAFGPSFGTVCFSGMVMGVVRVIRAIVDSARHDENARGFVNLMLQCCANTFLSAVDFVNKFTLNFAAITGDSYCSSAKMTYELLKRNLLSAVFVETVTTRILVGIIFVVSAVYAVAVYAILKAITGLGSEIYWVAALAWLLLFLVLAYFVHVLDNIVDTIYICYAIDRDKGEISKQEIHEVYALLPVSRNHSPSLIDRTPVLV